ncbi:hypothetical protein MG3_04179, partial [Candida albicans P78048]
GATEGAKTGADSTKK